MNQERLHGNWTELKGKITQQWGKLTNDDLTVVEGKMEELSGRVETRYGIAKEEAERQVHDFMTKHNSNAA